MDSPRNLARYKQQTELRTSDRNQMIGRCIAKLANTRRFHRHLIPHNLSLDLLSQMSKIFSCKWINDNSILLGCKDNLLFELSLASRPWSLHPIDVMGITRTSPLVAGIRMIRKNPTSIVVACGSSDSRDLAIIDTQAMRQIATLTTNHAPVVDCQWLGESSLLAGDRDGSLFVYDLLGASNQPIASYISHHEAGQNLKSMCMATRRDLFATVTSEGQFKVFDSSRIRAIHQLQLDQYGPLKRCQWNHYLNVTLVGSDQALLGIDPRKKGNVVFEIESADPRGIRSLSSEWYRATFGTGSGRIYFYDLRKPTVLLPFQPDPLPLQMPVARKSHYRIHGGYINEQQSPLYLEHFQGHEVEFAIHDHDFDSTSTRLLTVGGPTIVGIEGSHACLWM